MTSILGQEISNQLNVTMKERKLRGRNIAKIAGISKSYVSEIINGKRTPTIDKLNDMCNAIGIEIHELFTKIYLKQGKETQGDNYEKIKEGIDKLKLNV